MPTIGKNTGVRNAYEDFDVHHGALAKLPHPTRAQAIWVAKRIWRRAAGKAWYGTWVPGRGNHRTYPRGSRFLVNPGQGWAEIVHDMSHHLYHCAVCQRSRVCGKRVLDDFRSVKTTWRAHHTPSHALLERQMVAHALELIAKLPD
jgi:hypothetical protein